MVACLLAALMEGPLCLLVIDSIAVTLTDHPLDTNVKGHQALSPPVVPGSLPAVIPSNLGQAPIIKSPRSSHLPIIRVFCTRDISQDHRAACHSLPVSRLLSPAASGYYAPAATNAPDVPRCRRQRQRRYSGLLTGIGTLPCPVRDALSAWGRP